MVISNADSVTAEQKLKELILSKGAQMGTTETGKIWCLKALHPADPIVPFSGIPDEDSMPVVLQNYQQSVTCLNPSPSASGNWDLEVFFYPHPYIIGCIHTVDANQQEQWITILNNQIPGNTVQDKSNSFTALVERYRLGYLGVTGYHDAAALSNNGQIAAAQFCVTPTYHGIVSPVMTGQTDYLVRMLESWPNMPRKFEQLQSAPNSYFGAARDGVYVPYRLSETCQDWQGGTDRVVHGPYAFSANLNPYPYYALSSSPSPPDYPYGIAPPYKNQNGWSPLIHKRAGCGVIHISVRQLAQNASYTFYIRSGWEMQVVPGSQYMSFAKTSPVYDPTAIASYFTISRELKDAYPASYNDLGTILTTIGSIAASVLPTLFRPFKALVRKEPKTPKQDRSETGTEVARPVPRLEGAAQIERKMARLAAPAPPRQGPPPARKKLNVKRP